MVVEMSFEEHTFRSVEEEAENVHFIHAFLLR